jgi:hypothetical protein
VPPMSIREYSRTRRADRNSVRHAIATGLIVVDDDGRIAAWRPRCPVRPCGSPSGQDTGRAGWSPSSRRPAPDRSAKAKVAITLAKLRLVKQRFDAMRERYVDRAEAVAVGEQEANYVLQGLRAAPAAYAPTLAKEMGIPQEAAQRILDRFIGLTLVEIGDLPRQAKRDAERA